MFIKSWETKIYNNNNKKNEPWELRTPNKKHLLWDESKYVMPKYTTSKIKPQVKTTLNIFSCFKLNMERTTISQQITSVSLFPSYKLNAVFDLV